MVLFGKKLKELRKNQKITQQQLGEAVNVTKVSICCYENGTRTPSVETVIDLARFFNVSLDYLMGMNQYIVSDTDSSYGVKASEEEIALIKELRKNAVLYEQLLEEPERIIKLINNKIR